MAEEPAPQKCKILKMSDYLVTGIIREAGIRGVALVDTGLVEEARTRHQTYPVATAALGKAMSGAILLSSLLKYDSQQKVTLQIIGDGPLKEIVAEADAQGNVRGYVQKPRIHLPSKGGKLDIGLAVGQNGFLYVYKDLGLKEPYCGTVPLVSGELGKDLAYYLTVSEQLPSAVALGIYVESDNSVKASGGLLIQALPGVKEEALAHIEKELLELPPCSQLIMEGYSPERLLDLAVGEYSVTFTAKKEVHFSCRCSREKVESALYALGEAEIREMVEKKLEIPISCNFCSEIYIFSPKEMEKVLRAIKKAQNVKSKVQN